MQISTTIISLAAEIEEVKAFWLCVLYVPFSLELVEASLITVMHIQPMKWKMTRTIILQTWKTTYHLGETVLPWFNLYRRELSAPTMILCFLMLTVETMMNNQQPTLLPTCYKKYFSRDFSKDLMAIEIIKPPLYNFTTCSEKKTGLSPLPSSNLTLNLPKHGITSIVSTGEGTMAKLSPSMQRVHCALRLLLLKCWPLCTPRG
mmetsp:Transcript_2980/g.6475  ORF Transcript_2980/g.6475 Transcript_2980/m.6475 type:complete len:204 (+) Transcript_2980:1072-1683(+)